MPHKSFSFDTASEMWNTKKRLQRHNSSRIPRSSLHNNNNNLGTGTARYAVQTSTKWTSALAKVKGKNHE